MSFSPSLLFLSLVAGTIGLALLAYGKKQARLPHVVVGVLFMVYPYFTPTAVSMLVVGALLGAGLWWVIRLGW
jgi:hypothetical protein